MNSEIKIRRAATRQIPRPFSFHWGGGMVVEEASVKCELHDDYWEPTIQLLRYDSGEETLRFCVYKGRRLTRMPLLVGDYSLDALAREVQRNPRLKRLLTRLAGA